MMELLEIPFFSELFLAVAGMGLLMIAAFRGDGYTRHISVGVIVSFAIALLTLLNPAANLPENIGRFFVADPFSHFVKALILVASSIAVILAMNYWKNEKEEKAEFPLLILFATLGMLLMVSSTDFISMYLGIELQSLSLYILASFRRRALRSTEAGVKYFVLGALASGFLLYGMSLIYGATSTTEFSKIALSLAAGTPSLLLIVGLVMVLVGLAFKVSAVPFHMWTPDVYQGAPTPVAAFFAAAPKVAALALFLRLIAGPFASLHIEVTQIITVLSVLSMIVGALGAMMQRSLKRLLAYSAIGHVGYMLIGFAVGAAAIESILVYLTLYVFMGLGTFAVILSLRRQGRLVHDIHDLQGLAKTHPGSAFFMALFMFSMAGIPPLAGFFGKLYIFMAAINAGLYTLAIIGVLASVVAAFYYLRIVKVMYFEEAEEAPIDPVISVSLRGVIAVSGIVTLFFFASPGLLIDATKAAVMVMNP